MFNFFFFLGLELFNFLEEWDLDLDRDLLDACPPLDPCTPGFLCAEASLLLDADLLSLSDDEDEGDDELDSVELELLEDWRRRLLFLFVVDLDLVSGLDLRLTSEFPSTSIIRRLLSTNNSSTILHIYCL